MKSNGTEQELNLPDYERFAEYYDLFYSPRFDVDVTFWLDVAKEMGSPIIELGCGTGRIVIPLAKAGYHVHGLDLSSNMLKVTRRKLEEEPDISQNVTITLDDMRDFSLPCKFNLIIAARSVWFELHSAEDRLKAARCVLNHLKEGGCLVIDNTLVKREIRKSRSRMMLYRGTVAIGSDEYLSCFECDVFDEKAKICNDEMTIFLDKTSANGQVERQIFRFVFSYIQPNQTLEELKQAGFHNINIYGGHDRRLYDASNEELNERQLFFAKR